mgnify:CR=1 FL=1
MVKSIKIFHNNKEWQLQIEQIFYENRPIKVKYKVTDRSSDEIFHVYFEKTWKSDFNKESSFVELIGNQIEHQFKLNC